MIPAKAVAVGLAASLTYEDGRLFLDGPKGQVVATVGDRDGEATRLVLWSTPAFPLWGWGTTTATRWLGVAAFGPLWYDELRAHDRTGREVGHVPAGAGWIEQPRYPSDLTQRDAPCLIPRWSRVEVSDVCSAAGIELATGETPHARWFVRSLRKPYLEPPKASGIRLVSEKHYVGRRAKT